VKDCIQTALKSLRVESTTTAMHGRGSPVPLNYPQYFSRRQAASALGVSEQLISKLIKSHKLRAFKLGRIVRIDRRDLLSVLKESK
jgi:excisionase family DNA binding protein